MGIKAVCQINNLAGNDALCICNQPFQVLILELRGKCRGRSQSYNSNGNRQRGAERL